MNLYENSNNCNHNCNNILNHMNVSFFLWKSKRSKKTNLIPVYVMVNHNGICIRKPVKGVKTLEEQWDLIKQKIKSNLKEEDYNYFSEFNFEINNVATRLNNLWGRSFVNKTEITKELIIETILNTSTKPDEGELGLIDGFERFIAQNKSHRAPRTIIGYGTTLNVFKDYKKLNKFDDKLSNIDMHFFDHFRNYCFGTRGFKNNTFSKTINNLKSFMNWSQKRGYHSNNTFRDFKAPEESIEVIYLTPKELMKLYTTKFERSSLEKAKDVYTFSCFTGLRYSDLSNLNSSKIHEDHIIINVTKTKAKDLIIPLIKQAKEILIKYSDTRLSPLPMISSQKLNEYIKEACKVAEINTPITITRYSGNKRIEKTVPKYELITLHTGRKTFVTNSLSLGMSPFQVKEITGHLSDSAFKKYVNVSNEDKIKQLNSAWEKL